MHYTLFLPAFLCIYIENYESLYVADFGFCFPF